MERFLKCSSFLAIDMLVNSTLRGVYVFHLFKFFSLSDQTTIRLIGSVSLFTLKFPVDQQ